MADDLVFVGVKLPRPLFTRLQAYARAHRYTVSELLRDGVEWRLGEGNDPLAYRYGQAEKTSTGDTISDVDLLADQEQAAALRHQDIMGLLRAIREHQRGQQPVESLPAPVSTVKPVKHPAPDVADAPVSTVRSVKPHAAVASGVPVDPVILVKPSETAYDPATFDTTKFYLGKLCPKNHDYHGTGLSLLRRHNQSCRECENTSRREKRAREKIEREAQPVTG